jgi:glyoxylase-like metal-dependent hydrolase (beta-lactamase superfamily II)
MAMKELAPGVYMISLGMVNAYLLDAGELTLIDTGPPGSEAKILAAMGELGQRPTDLRHILVTHCHTDHAGSLAALKQAAPAQAYMHPLDAALVREGRSMRPVKPAPGLLPGLLFNLLIRAAPTALPAAVIDHELNDGDELPFAGGLKAIHAPGHCAGQLVFLWPHYGGLLIVADAASNVMRLGLSIIYEDLAEGQRSLSKLAALNFEMACFGHGGPIKSGASARFRQKWG